MRDTARISPLFAVAAGLATILVTAACGSNSSKAAVTTDPTVTVTRTGAASSSSGTDCTTAQLTMTLGASDGAAGTIYRPLVLTNTGSTPCTISGFPGVSFVAGTDNHQVGNPAQRSGTGTPAALTLQPGGKASATIGVTQAGNYDAAACTPTPVTGFRIYPPNETASSVVAFTGTGCANTGVTVLTVTALVAAS